MYSKLNFVGLILFDALYFEVPSHVFIISAFCVHPHPHSCKFSYRNLAVHLYAALSLDIFWGCVNICMHVQVYTWAETSLTLAAERKT